MRIRGIAIAALAVFLLSGIFLAVGDFVNRKWDGRTRYTVLDLQNGLTVESIDLSTRSGLRIKFPGNFEVDTVGGRGSWQVKALDDLATKFGSKWVADSMFDYLGVGYTAEKSDLGIWDKISWWNESRQIQWKEVNIGDTDYVMDKKDVDGTIVLNTTKEIGLGNHAAVFIENTGIKVAMVDTNLQLLDKCLVTGTERALKTVTADFIIRSLQCNKKINGNSEKELTLELGQSYRWWWKGQF
jgi:hypothetical protein